MPRANSTPRSRRRHTWSGLAALETRLLCSGDALPFGADYRDGSEMMVGSVAVTVVLLESDGSSDINREQWSPDEITQVKSQIDEGLTWWAQTFEQVNAASTHDLSFVVDWTLTDTPAATAYEPIARPRTDEHLWGNDFLTAAGADTGASFLTDMQRFNHSQRVRLGTNWAFTVFVADSSNDADGRFSDGAFAYAYHGGPMLVMTYDNGAWGASEMGRVFAHEMGHIFYALDEYISGDSYDARSGYYGAANTNAAKANPNPVGRQTSLMARASVMSNAYDEHTSSAASFEMIGWKDSDGDGVFDAMDVPLTLEGGGELDEAAGQYRFEGRSHASTLLNRNSRGVGHDLTLNTIDAIQYRIDDGTWVTAEHYGVYETAVNVSTELAGEDALASGGHLIQWRTIDFDTGVSSNVVADLFTIDHATGPPTGDSTTPVTVTWADTQRIGPTHISFADPLPHTPFESINAAAPQPHFFSSSHGKLTVVDDDGTTLTISLRGDGRGTATANAAGGFDLHLSNTTARTKLQLKPGRGGDGQVAVANIISYGPLNAIDGRRVDLLGDVIVAGGLRKLTMGDVIGGDQRIDIGQGKSQRDTLNVRLAGVRDLTLTSQTPIASLTADQWRDADDIDDMVKGPSIGSVRVKGNFEADIRTTDAAAKLGIRSASIRGWVGGARIHSAAPVGSVTVGGMRHSSVSVGAARAISAPDRPGSVDDRQSSLRSLTVRGIRGRSDATFTDSTIDAAWIGRIKLGQVETDNAGRHFGVTARQLRSYKRPGQAKALSPDAMLLDMEDDFAVSLV